MQKEIAVLIGGPGTGKSALIESLTQKGYCCYPEISREITLEAQKKGVDQLFLQDPLLFSALLLEGRREQYKKAMAAHNNPVFIDRGIPDIVAYLKYLNMDYPSHFDTACRESRYNRVFVLPPWEAIFESDNERYETFEQAKKIHEHLIRAYSALGYELIEVPEGTVEKRVQFLFEILNVDFE
jgi:predicted ATPase